jgi:lysophospholipid acyltransferase (LPLAT)-like uncharacterized protein
LISLRNISRSVWFQRAAGFLAAEFLRLVWLTNSFELDPPDIYERVDGDFPLIIAFWHGQHFMMPFIKRDRDRAKVLVSRHRDGEINAITAERLGLKTIRASGASGRDIVRKGGVAGFKAMLDALEEGCAFHRKGGVGAFREMVFALRDGWNMALTADVPKVSRRAGLGIIMLARESGRGILPVAIATSRFRRLKNWDQTVIHLPFGRGAAAVGEMVHVPADADAETMEKLRVQLEAALNDANRRAYAMVGRPDEGRT